MKRGDSKTEHSSSLYAIATLDGEIILAEGTDLIWSVQTGSEQLFSIRKMDVNDDGKDEILVSSWKGSVRFILDIRDAKNSETGQFFQTFVVTQDKKMTEFLLGESICAFNCGKFEVDGTEKSVLFFVTFNGKIVCHYDFQLTSGEFANLAIYGLLPYNFAVVGKIDTLLNLSGEMKKLLREKGIAIETEEDMRKLNNYLLYGFR